MAGARSFVTNRNGPGSALGVTSCADANPDQQSREGTMKAFLASCVACIAIAVIAAVALEATDDSTAQAFSIKSTVRVGN